MNNKILQKKLYKKTKNFGNQTVSNNTQPTNNVIRNPDVISKLKNYQRDRDNEENNFDKNLINKTYKKIIYDKNIPKNINSIKDLSIDIGRYNEREFINNMNNKLKERNYADDDLRKTYNETKKEEYKKIFEFRNNEIPKIIQQKIQNENINDFDTLKFNTNDYFRRENDELNKYKQEMLNFINQMNRR
jgi:hypothetical protein